MRVICGGFWSGLYAFSGCNLFVVLHSFLSFASLPIRRSPAREIGGLSVAGVVVSCRISCIGHILVAMSGVSGVEERHDFGCRCVYLVGSCCVAN